MDEKEMEEELEASRRSPMIYILAVFLALIVVVMAVPYYGIKADPRPERIPEIDDVFAYDGEFTAPDSFEIDKEDAYIRQVAAKVAAISCPDGERVCHAKALFYFVKNNINYVRDPLDIEYVEDPKEVLSVGGADCESGALLLASLMESVGISSQLVLVPGHAFLRIDLPEARKAYRQDGDWVYLDWTCCDFGETSRSYAGQERRFIDL